MGVRGVKLPRGPTCDLLSETFGDASFACRGAEPELAHHQQPRRLTEGGQHCRSVAWHAAVMHWAPDRGRTRPPHPGRQAGRQAPHPGRQAGRQAGRHSDTQTGMHAGRQAGR